VQDSGEPMDAEERDALLHAELHSKHFLSATGWAATWAGHRPQLIRLMHGEFGIKSGTNRAAPCG
jgi:hypothetical protein